MSKICDDCLMTYCSYEPHSEECQSARVFPSEYVYFELNDWWSDTYYPNEEPFKTWVEMRKENKYYVPLCDENWVKENKLVVVSSTVDMSKNYCITAKRDWVKENCPKLLTKYTKFIRENEYDDETPPDGRFGCPFLEYTEENIGIHYYEEDEDGCYVEYVEEDNKD